ncbi:MAG: ABC transporter permease [Cryobacterium sp.]|nr:ABC transporter permease [Cryobacterium sp.]
MRIITGIVGAVDEAWSELRIHRTRVLLSLVGVAVAVAALTGVVALGAMAQQATTESYERQSGRPATLYASAYSMTTETLAPADVRAAFDQVVDRYQITYAGAVGYAASIVQFVGGAQYVSAMTVEPDYATMHRVILSEGRWFTERDAERLAPVIVVNQHFYERIGSPNLATHPTVSLLGDHETVAVIIGVVPASEYEDLSMFLLNSAYLRIAPPSELEYAMPQFEMWVPTDLADQLIELVRRDMSGALGPDVQVDVSRQDYEVWGGGLDPLEPIRMLVLGAAGIVLLLGALGLVNISLVTVRQRIREIGVRRSFGATAGRVFFSVMMESVVGAVVAGVVGVFLAVLLVSNPLVQQSVAPGILDMPAFPIDAALLGLAAATAVGALAGLLPALYAVRVKVIDAIRY